MQQKRSLGMERGVIGAVDAEIKAGGLLFGGRGCEGGIRLAEPKGYLVCFGVSRHNTTPSRSTSAWIGNPVVIVVPNL